MIFQRRFSVFVCCFKCRLSRSQRIIQRFYLIVQRLVAVCNGFFQSFLRIIEIFLNLIYNGLKRSLSCFYLTFQIRLVALVGCLKCRLSSIKRIIQRFDLIVESLVAVCNGFFELCFGIIEILLNLIYCGLQCRLCRGDLPLQRGLIRFVCFLKCRLSSIQRITQCFELFIESLVAVFNGFFQRFFSLFQFFLQICQRLRGECPFRGQDQIFVHRRVKEVHKVPVIPANESTCILRSDRCFYAFTFIQHVGCVNLAVAVEVNRYNVLILADACYFAIVHTGFNVTCRVFAVAGHVTEEREFGFVGFVDFFNAAFGYHSTVDHTVVCTNGSIAVYRAAFSRRRAIFNPASVVQFDQTRF